MLRKAYLLILRLHPRRFRQDFAEEMLLIFDQVADQVAASSTQATLAETKLLGDGLVSLLRQWGLRPEFRREPALAAARLPNDDGVPAFYTFGNFRPRPMALLHGSILSIAVLCAASLAMRYAWNHTVNLPFPIVDREGEASSPEREIVIIPSVIADAADTQSPPSSASPTARSALSKPLSTQGRFLPLPVETALPATAPVDKVSRKTQAMDRQAHFSSVPLPLARPGTAGTLSPQLLQRYAGNYVAPPEEKASGKMQTNLDRRVDFVAVPSPLARPSTAVTLPSRLLQRYAGNYVAPPALRVSVIAKDGELQIEMAGQPRRALQPVSETTFRATGLADYQVEFQTNPDGTVRQLMIGQSGHRVVAVRQ
jgi:hypothetical protein